MFCRSIQRISRPAATRLAARWYTDSARTIHERLKTDLKSAMKAREKERLIVIKGILSDIMYAEKNPGASERFSKTNDGDVAGLIQRAIRQRDESAQAYRTGGREDLATSEELEASILKSYLPEQLSDAQIEAEINAVVERLGVSGTKAMGAVMKNVSISPSQASKSRVAEAVKRALSRQ